MTEARRTRLKRVLAITLAAMALIWVLEATPDVPSLASLYQQTECGAADDPCFVSGRQYNVLLPQGEGPFPAVLFFHGSNGTGAKIISSAHLALPILKRGYALIAPTALEIEYRNGPGTGWVWRAGQSDRDDYAFASAVLDDATSRFPIDINKILTAGSSRGGSFAWYLACANIDEHLRAFAPVMGTPVRGRPGPCATSGFAFDMFHTHGFQDTVIPFAGNGPFDNWPGYLGAVEVVDTMAHLAGCSDLDITEQANQVLRRWSGCLTGARVSVLGFEGGHVIPVGWAEMAIEWFDNLHQQKGW